MNKISKLLNIILLINYILVLYTFVLYGNMVNNPLFDICKNNLFIFTLINLLIYLFIKYFSVIKILIKS